MYQQPTSQGGTMATHDYLLFSWNNVCISFSQQSKLSLLAGSIVLV